MSKPYPNERVMLICWSWREFEKAGYIVNHKLLNQSAYQKAFDQPSAFQNKLFDEYRVCDQLPDGSKLPVDPKAVVVRTYIEQEAHNLNSLSFKYLKALIEHYNTADNELFVFLHRADEFTDLEVGAVLKDTGAEKCFLIGGGISHIYYRGFRNQGILGDNKYFYRAAVEKDKPAITVANNKTKQLFQPHFDKVWDYYKHEFQTKIFELKEDLLSFFYVVYPDDVPWDGEKMLKMLKENECLFLRVHSFIDHPDYPFTNSDLLHLKEYGYEAEKSFEFDDCRKNLSTPDQLEKEFGKVSSLLVGLFFFI